MNWTKATVIWTLFTKIYKWWGDRKKKKAEKKEIEEYIDELERLYKQEKENEKNDTPVKDTKE